MTRQLPIFVESYECRCGAHCTTCRATGLGGRSWRESVARFFEMPSGAPDFECPPERGSKPWGTATTTIVDVIGGLADLPPHEWGPPLWADLHTKRGADQAWLDAFTARVPCGTCKGDWLAMLAATPPVFGEGWFAWTVDRHNEVNERLGKPRVTLEEAEQIWGVSTPIRAGVDDISQGV